MASMVFDGAGEWLANQRWFGAKDRTIEHIIPTNIWQVSSPEEHPTWLITVDLHGQDKSIGTITLLVTRCSADDPDRIGEVDHIPVAEVSTRPGAILVLVRAVLDHRSLPDGLRSGSMNTLTELPLKEARVIGGEQSNSTFEVDGQVAVKLNRTFEDGPDPEFELGRELTLAKTPGVVPLLGVMVGPRLEGIITIHALVHDAINGWEAAMDTMRGKDVLLSPSWMYTLGQHLKTIHKHLHDRLPVDAPHLNAHDWEERLNTNSQETIQAMAEAGFDATGGLMNHLNYVLGHLPRHPEPVQRVHGDLHLGQTLIESDGDWWIIDFAGEPGRSHSERHEPKGRMHDLAGLTRSIAYAEATAIREGMDPRFAHEWAQASRKQLLSGYGLTTADRQWLYVHELERHLYEVRYELSHRPEWAAVPLSGFDDDPTDIIRADTPPAPIIPTVVTKAKPKSSQGDHYAIVIDTPTPINGASTDTKPVGMTAPSDVQTHEPDEDTDPDSESDPAEEDAPTDDTPQTMSTDVQVEVQVNDPSQSDTDSAPISPVSSDTIDLPSDDEEDTMTDMSSGSEPEPRPSHDVLLEMAPQLADGRCVAPHDVLGVHRTADGWVHRIWRPDATDVFYHVTPDAAPVAATERHPGLFESPFFDDQPNPGQARWQVHYGDDVFTLVDPYAFEPTIGELDRYLWGEGRHEEAWTMLGANRRTLHGISGIAFAVWAPNAHAVRVIGEFNSWDGRLHPMRSLGESGIWELFIPDVPDGSLYKFELVTADQRLVTRADPFAKYAEIPPGQASRVFTSSGIDTASPNWTPEERPHAEQLSIYEVHLGSWRWHENRPLTYAELADELVPYVKELGFTHVEFLPVAEHPYAPSWGYQVTGQFAPTSRYGSPDDFRKLVKAFHDAGIGVIVDWVPAHFPKDEWALAQFDGTHLFEHADPRQGEHPDWGTLVYNYGRNEVRNFLVASALFWIEEMGVDGLRVDAVASMLYLDYSREEGEWVPNEYGGRENLAAVRFLQEVNATVYKRNPYALMIAEESTSWDGVSRPTDQGGLGFGFKWNMGWMHDTLEYIQHETVHRKWHHDDLTFGLVYAWSENFVLPLSHDEVVHGKEALLAKMPGDDWQKFANLRALYAWMWGHPGKQLLFMGSEFGQWREWSSERELDWGCLAAEPHIGIHKLVTDLNTVQAQYHAMYELDTVPEGFTWLIGDDADDNILAFVRNSVDEHPPVVVVANFAPVPRYDFPIPLPQRGAWREILNTDADIYGGSGVGNQGCVHAGLEGFNGQPASTRMTIPPLGVLYFTPDLDKS
ncbi:1,4-alpha-glucan branching protein GlgB [Stomatohabitans albus]|uniref:1,4-alpha-glucan branching protein GlgB n=1 Tax=Stomatohabitans albus TaxID=3110766 RepID=UPI00300DB54E